MEENYNDQKEENYGQMPTNSFEYNQDYNYTPTQDYNQQNNNVISVGEWFLMILATIVPCLGLVLYLVWAFGSNDNPNRKNYCRAWLIFYLIQTVLVIIILVVFSASLMPVIMNSYY